MRALQTLFISLFFIIFSGLAVANIDPVKKTNEPIQLREQPQQQAKVIATIKPGETIIPIITQGDWSKIADANNGNVGWVENKTLAENNYPSIYFKVSSEAGKNGSGYQVMQYSSNSGNLNQEQIDKMLQNWQARQEQWSQQIDKLMSDNMAAFNQMMQQMQKNFADMQTADAPAKKSKAD